MEEEYVVILRMREGRECSFQQLDQQIQIVLVEL